MLTSTLRARRCYQRAGLLSLALLVVPFLPASNILFPVGTVIGERLLYIPSAGFCLAVIVWLHRMYSSTESSDAPGYAPSIKDSNGKARENGRRHAANTKVSRPDDNIVSAGRKTAVHTY